MGFAIIFGSVMSGILIGIIFCKLFYSSEIKGTLFVTHDDDEPPMMMLKLDDYDSIPKFGVITFEVKHKYPHA